jgi:hypothetical protein
MTRTLQKADQSLVQEFLVVSARSRPPNPMNSVDRVLLQALVVGVG